MRVFSHSLLLGLAAVMFAAATAVGQEYSVVPTATDQIADSVLRDALTQYSPNYNYLTRADQVRAYVNIYQSLHGVQPALTTQDNSLLTQQVYVVPSSPQVYYYDAPPVYYQPVRPGFSFGIGFGDRWGGRPGWGRPGWHGRPPHFGPGRPGRPGGPGHGPGRPGRPPRPR